MTKSHGMQSGVDLSIAVRPNDLLRLVKQSYGKLRLSFRCGLVSHRHLHIKKPRIPTNHRIRNRFVGFIIQHHRNVFCLIFSSVA